MTQYEVVAYPKIPDVMHHFAVRVQFGTTFEVIEFLSGHEIKLSQRMVEEHVEKQMIQCALEGTAEREDERALDKIGQMRNADEGRIDIELPPLNAVL